MKLMLLFAMMATPMVAADEIRLWSGVAPGSEGNDKPDVVEPANKDHNFIRVTGIHRPSITVYLPPKEKATGAAVVIAPGGGHRFLAMHEGYDIAEWLNSIGVAGFVLKYRLAREEGSPYKVDVHALQDAQQAIRMIRSRAAEWGVNPARVGIMGFSAGGEVAMLASTRFEANSRPDFQVLVYPGIRVDPNTDYPKDTPPAFLICTYDDKGPSMAVPNYYLAMKKAGVNAEMHVYSRGGHGYGMRERPMPVSSWNARLKEWMADQGLLR